MTIIINEIMYPLNKDEQNIVLDNTCADSSCEYIQDLIDEVRDY